LIFKVVIDTNIYISAIFWGGKPRKIIDLGREEKIDKFVKKYREEKPLRYIPVSVFSGDLVLK